MNLKLVLASTIALAVNAKPSTSSKFDEIIALMPLMDNHFRICHASCEQVHLTDQCRQSLQDCNDRLKVEEGLPFLCRGVMVYYPEKFPGCEDELISSVGKPEREFVACLYNCLLSIGMTRFY